MACGVLQVEVEPVREHFAGADRGAQHQGGRVVVRRQAHGVRLQGQDQEQRHPLPLHLGQGHPPARQLRCRPRPVQVQPPGRVHGDLLTAPSFLVPILQPSFFFAESVVLFRV